MSKQSINPNVKQPTLFLALLPILTMVLLLSLGYVMFELPPEPLIIASTVVAGLIAIKLGYKYDDILESIAQKIAKTMPAILILITVGFMIGAWMAGGTIPMMIYYGLKIINPQFLLITAFLVTSVVSICTGTSWGSAGTIGVAFMGVGAGMDVNLAAVAGAVVAGRILATNCLLFPTRRILLHYPQALICTSISAICCIRRCHRLSLPASSTSLPGLTRTLQVL